MAILNITLNGMSADTRIEIDFEIGDADLKRVAVELIRSGDVPGLHIRNLSTNAFDHYVIDRFNTRDGVRRLYLRPKVPFGRGAAESTTPVAELPSEVAGARPR